MLWRYTLYKEPQNGSYIVYVLKGSKCTFYPCANLLSMQETIMQEPVRSRERPVMPWPLPTCRFKSCRYQGPRWHVVEPCTRHGDVWNIHFKWSAHEHYYPPQVQLRWHVHSALPQMYNRVWSHCCIGKTTPVPSVLAHISNVLWLSE